MDEETLREEFENYWRLRKELEHHNQRYFQDLEPEIGDLSYDALMYELKNMEARHPEWKNHSSPTQQLGEKIQTQNVCEHIKPMLSLDKVFDLQDLKRFYDKTVQSTKTTKFQLELKVDGCAVALHYRYGKFAKALTRGDGFKGDDITDKIERIEGVLTQVSAWEDEELVELRAEVYMTYESFDEFNKVRQNSGLKTFANPRNATAGALKLLDMQEFDRRKVKIGIYAINYDSKKKVTSLQQSWNELHSLGFACVPWHRACTSFEHIVSAIHEVEHMRESLGFGIDGVVVKINSYEWHERLGTTGQYYRWAMAYKFTPKKAFTQLRKIDVQVGRTGVITPVAQMIPIFLDGSLVKRCSLHNLDEIRRLDIREGDWVEIMKGGDIIPKILQVDLSRRPENSKIWQMPEGCPSCKSTLVYHEEEVAVRCMNLDCPAQLVRKLIYFCSKDGLDIEGMGEKTVELLFERGAIKTYKDVFFLRAEDFVGIDGFGEKSIGNILHSIQEKSSVRFDRLIYAMGLPHIGIHLAKILAKHFESLESLVFAETQDLIDLEGIGELVANALVYFLSQSQGPKDLLDLERRGVIKIEYLQRHHEQTLKEMSFVVTGTLKNYGRSEIEEKIHLLGGKVSSSVSKKTTYVLCGQNPGSKLEKAHKLGVSVIDEETFEQLAGVQ